MADPTSIVDLTTLRQAALYQQIVGEIVTLCHLAVIGGIGLLYMRWKERQTLKRAASTWSPLPKLENPFSFCELTDT